MHYQFLIEDQSGEIFVNKVMQSLMANTENLTYDCKSFHGIGGFTRKNTIKETKSGKLLNDLATYMRGFQRSLQGIDAFLIVLVDNDDRETDAFRTELEKVAENNHITMDHVFCIAVEELEAWLLGEIPAIMKAYPRMRESAIKQYKQDSICGTWEVLADAVYPGGMRQLSKDKLPFWEIGKLKCEWADRIGEVMTFENNVSPSFQVFWSTLKEHLPQ